MINDLPDARGQRMFRRGIVMEQKAEPSATITKEALTL